MPKQIGFTRWYDRSPQVSQAVRTLEKAETDFQRSIAEIINEMTDMRNLSAKSEGGLKKIGSQKILGLMKSKAKRRWYDENPQMHKAINTMYIMDEDDRDEVALKILVSLTALGEYKNRCLKEETRPAYREMLAIVKSVFQKDTNALMPLIKIKATGSDGAALMDEVVREAASSAEEESKKSGDIVDSGDGLKIGFNRLSTNNTLI